MDNYLDSIIEKKLSDVKNNQNEYSIGFVTKINGYILEVVGLDDVKFFEEVEILDKGLAYVTKISPNSVTLALVKETVPIQVGDKVIAKKKIFTARFSEQSLGTIIDIFGKNLLSEKYFDKLIDIEIDTPTIPILERIPVTEPLFTGVSGIDLFYPVGKGQRQLIVGDKKTGKTQLALDTINNQKEKMISIYIAIGKTKKEVKELYFSLQNKQAMHNTIILAAFQGEPSPILKNTLNVGLSIAEHFMYQGKEVLVVIDDLKRHADTCREMALLSGKMPGRDAYPTDIFYTHAKVLEKGGNFKGYGSISILPIVETKAGDITDYITTNIVSITDGQIVLSTKNFEKGLKPAINYTLSVSRLGGAVQEPVLKKVGAKVRQEYLSYLEKKDIYELTNIDDLSEAIREQFLRGVKYQSALVQSKYSPKTKEEMLELFSNIIEGA